MRIGTGGAGLNWWGNPLQTVGFALGVFKKGVVKGKNMFKILTDR
jgi:hypothetical protein